MEDDGTLLCVCVLDDFLQGFQWVEKHQALLLSYKLMALWSLAATVWDTHTHFLPSKQENVQFTHTCLYTDPHLHSPSQTFFCTHAASCHACARPCRHMRFSDFLSLDHWLLLCCPQTLSWGLQVILTSAPPHYPHLSYRHRRLDVAAGHPCSQTAGSSPQTLCSNAQLPYTLFTKGTGTLCILCSYPWLEIQLALISLLVMHKSVSTFYLQFDWPTVIFLFFPLLIIVFFSQTCHNKQFEIWGRTH